jgi:Zn-dependent peptidase ImmA (M78 family)
MILPLVRDMFTMSAKWLGTRFPRKYQTLKIIAHERWPHIMIEEKQFKQKINAHRQVVGNSSLYWIIFINSELPEKKKYYTLVHEIMHCYIDEVRLLNNTNEKEKIIRLVDNAIKKF